MTPSDAVPAADVAAKLTPVVLDVSDDKAVVRRRSELPNFLRRRQQRGGPRRPHLVVLRWRCPPVSSKARALSSTNRFGAPMLGAGLVFLEERRGFHDDRAPGWCFGHPVPGIAAVVCDQGCGSGRSWDVRSLVFDDGDVLHWVIEVVPGVEPSVVYYRTDRTGSLPSIAGARLLRQHGHPDAELAQPANHPRPVRRLSCGPAPRLNLAPNG
jgi:hypothetical protein